MPNTGSVSSGASPVVADPLPTHLPEGVVGATAVELVDGHGIGEVEHVDLLELRGGPVLRCHHVEGEVGDIDDAGITLADARGLDDDQVETGGPQAATTIGRGGGISEAEPRVASDRKYTRDGSMAFILIRSPRRAPPPRRRVGSTASTATASLSSWSCRKRRMISSVSDDFPDPPVPVTPSTGAFRRCAADRSPRWSAGRGIRPRDR